MEENLTASSFVNLLASLSTPDNQVRAEAEQQYEALKGHADGFLAFSLLTTTITATAPTHIRKLSAVLLRRILIQDENSAYSQLSEIKQVEFRTQLLQALDNETDAYMKARICDIVGELANFVIDEWPEILPYTHHCLQSMDSLQKETGLSLLNLLAEQVASLLCNGDSIETMIPIFEQCLVDSSNEGRIMLSSLRALVSILSCVAQPSDIERFQCLLTPLLAGLKMLLQWEDGEAAALSYAEAMIELAEDCVAFYESNLDLLFASIAACVAADSGVSLPLRHMFMELLVTLCGETTKKVRKLKGPDGQKGYFIQVLVPICVSMMVSIPEDPHWSLSETAEENDSEDVMDCDVGETSLDRMCRDLGLTATWAVVSAQFTDLLQSEVWQHCHAGLRCLGNYMEVSKNISNKKQLRQHVMDMALLILPFMKHGHDRVRAAAYYAFGQFITMHGRGQGLDSSQIDQTVPLLVEGLPLAVNSSPRVRRNALIALSNTVDICPANIIQTHAGTILQAVAGALAEGPVIVQEMCVAVIIGLAETSEGSVLCEYYDAIIPVLKQLLAHSMANGLESLWGQGMECCAMVGEASGKEKFYPDALEMMNSLVAMGNELEEGSEARTYLMKAWVRIARCLESDFLPFLPLVMAQLMTAIQQDVTAGDDMDPEELETRSDLHMVEMESGWVAVRTAAVEEQSSACQLVMLMVEKLQEHFYPNVEATVNAIAPLLESPHEDVRSFCMVAIPELVRSTAKATSPDRTALINLTEYFVGLLVKSIESESSLELIMTGLQALRATFSYACTDWTLHTRGMREPAKITPATSIRFLNVSQMEAITQCATLVLRDSLQRRAILRAEAQVSGGGVDEDDMGDEEMFQQNCMELHFNLAELIGTVFKTHGSDFMIVYRQIWHETVVQMVHVNCLKEDRQFGYFIISDVIEFGLTNETAGEYFTTIMANVLEGCQSEEEGIRQTSVYCIGIAAELYPSMFLPFAASSLTALSGAISMGDGDESRGMSTDNAVSSVGILLEQMQAVLGGGNTADAPLTASFPFVWGEWLAYLPLRDDVEEGARVLRQLAKLLRNKHATLFSSLERVEQAVLVLVEVLGSELVGPEVTREVVHTLQLMRVGDSLLGKGGMEQLCAKLDPERGEKLRRYLSMDFSSPLESSSPQAPAPIHDVLMRF